MEEDMQDCMHCVKKKNENKGKATSKLTKAGPTFPPPGWWFMLSVGPILELAFLMSGAVAVPG